jgi:protein gp37
MLTVKELDFSAWGPVRLTGAGAFEQPSKVVHVLFHACYNLDGGNGRDMGDRSAIEWTDATWNPVTGCTKITRGCDNCYAARFSERFRDVSGHPFSTGFDLTLRPERLNQPLTWRRPRMIFVNSMSDLFHKQVPFTFVDQVFDTMETAQWHIFQVLTKRSSLMRDYLRRRYRGNRGPGHIWCGVSVEDAQAKGRIEHLRSANSEVRFLSIEPLIGAVGAIDLTGINWVIAGGESGPGARPLRLEWVREIRDQCLGQNVAFFFKQWGGIRPKSGGRELDGREWSEFPTLKARAL